MPITILSQVPTPVRDHVVGIVCAEFGVYQDRLLSRSRVSSLIEPRWVAETVLHDLGNSPAAIARAMHRDHSSVTHGIARVASSTELRTMSRAILGGLPPWVYTDMGRQRQTPTLSRRLDYALRGLRADVQGAIRAYCLVVLQGQAHRSGLVWWGAYYLATWPHHTQRVLAAMDASEQVRLVTLLGQHSTTLGF